VGAFLLRFKIDVDDDDVELHRLEGETTKAEIQARANERLREAVRGVEKCGVRLGMAREVGYH
jgi:hypothetical protein